MSLLASLPSASPYLLTGHSGGGGSTVQGRLRRDGRFLVNDAGTFRARFVSALTLLTKNDADCDAYLDWVQATGFNGIRVFAGHLSWAGQTAESARARLDYVLREARKRHLYAEITCLTDTKAGAYDKRMHVQACGSICAQHENSLIEIANEAGHPTQDDETNDPDRLKDYRSLIPSDVLCALGAPGFDEPDPSGVFPFPTLDYVTVHLDRGRDIWNQIRRIRELEAVSNSTQKPVLNNEPIGADEVTKPGSRESNPFIFYALGVLNRLFEVGGVHHSQHGLMAELPWPNQQACAEAFIAGSTVIPTEERLTFKNAGWGDSPVRSADFTAVVRAYSGVAGDRAWTVLLGISGGRDALELQNGWRVVRDIGEMPGVRVLELER